MGEHAMKKSLLIIVVLLVLSLAGYAYASVSSVTLFDTIPEYTTDELLQLKILIDEELARRSDPDYANVQTQPTYMLNIKSKKFHIPSCENVDRTKIENRREFFGERNELISTGYTPCGNCNP
jgi:hypothetical protein